MDELDARPDDALEYIRKAEQRRHDALYDQKFVDGTPFFVQLARTGEIRIGVPKGNADIGRNLWERVDSWLVVRGSRFTGRLADDALLAELIWDFRSYLRVGAKEAGKDGQNVP